MTSLDKYLDKLQNRLVRTRRDKHMKSEIHIHSAQTAVLNKLLFVGQARFTDLQLQTGLTSAHFKFHIEQLLNAKFIEKTTSNNYRLTASGKEYANKLDTDKNTFERQPKCSIILVIEQIQNGKTTYLAQQRLKHPYFGFWGFPGGKIRWGETILAAASRELFEETKLAATLTHMGVYHEHAVQAETGDLLEDKIFHVIRGINPEGDLLESFEGGKNTWFTLDEIRNQEHRYSSFDIEANIGTGKCQFIEAVQVYSKQQF